LFAAPSFVHDIDIVIDVDLWCVASVLFILATVLLPIRGVRELRSFLGLSDVS
jgi:hypothetical protein